MLGIRDIVDSVVWEHFISDHGSSTAKNGDSLGKYFCLSLILFLFCLPNVSHKYYFDTETDQFSSQTKKRTGDYFLVECCVSSWSTCVLKQGIPWQLFLCFKKILSWNRRRSIVCTIQGRPGEYFLGERCVRSWISYVLLEGSTV